MSAESASIGNVKPKINRLIRLAVMQPERFGKPGRNLPRAIHVRPDANDAGWRDSARVGAAPSKQCKFLKPLKN